MLVCLTGIKKSWNVALGWGQSLYAQSLFCGFGAYISIHGDAIGVLLKLEHQV